MAFQFTEEGGFGLAVDRLTWVHWLAIALVAVTGGIHVALFFTEDWLPMLLAGLGFFGAIVLFLLNVSRALLYPVGVVYTGSQIVGYLLLPLGPLWIGILDKVVQVSLIVLLGYLFRRDVLARK